MAILLVLIAAVFGAISNYCMRRSIDYGGSAKAFLVIQLFFSFVAVFFLTTFKSNEYAWDIKGSGIGIPGGIILGAMMWAIGRSLEYGPAGLTFAAHNSASVMPAIFMAYFFGLSCGHIYTFWNGIGSALVIFGLFWAGASKDRSNKRHFWLIFISLAFTLHVFYISFMQWRALLLNPLYAHQKFIPFCIEGIPSQWFMPLIFLTATIMQLLIYLLSKQKWPNEKVLFWGFIGGIANGLNLFFIIKATEISTILEKSMIFPVACVSTIILCNLWAQFLYKETIKWKANTLCILGLVIGTINWNAFF